MIRRTSLIPFFLLMRIHNGMKNSRTQYALWNKAASAIRPAENKYSFVDLARTRSNMAIIAMIKAIELRYRQASNIAEKIR